MLKIFSHTLREDPFSAAIIDRFKLDINNLETGIERTLDRFRVSVG